MSHSARRSFRPGFEALEHRDAPSAFGTGAEIFRHRHVGEVVHHRPEHRPEIEVHRPEIGDDFGDDFGGEGGAHA